MRERRIWKLVMAPKKNDDKVPELIQRGSDRFDAIEGKLSTMEEWMNGMMTSGFKRLELRKADQTEEKDRRETWLISSGLISNPDDTLKLASYKGEGSREKILEETRSVFGVQFVMESGP